ncbi:DNA-directed RNA polymerase III subunit RPC3-like [Panonychus citri]|nr:DNA-directed RNA polymerase III subunit RPC3-like [Panonychus citri]
MTKQTIKLCSLLLKEYFGEIISTVGSSVMSLSKAPLRLICLESGESVKNVKKSLAVLIHHCLITTSKHARGFIEYKAEPERILYLLRYPKYIYIAKSVFGDFGEQIVEEILGEGIMTPDGIVSKVYNRMKNTSENRDTDNYPNLIFEVLARMVQAKYIVRACVISNETNETDWFPSTIETEDEFRAMQKSAISGLVKSENETSEPATKRQRKEPQAKEDVYYMVNPDQFHLYLRDMTILEGLKAHYDDEKAAQLVQVMLRLSQSSPWTKETIAISKSDIVSHCLRENLFPSRDIVDEYLLFLTDDDTRFVVKVDERSGVAMYRVNILLIHDKLIQSSISTIVTDRFGSQCGRIFRLLLSRKYLHQKQIEELAMIPAKDAKECTYNLMTNNFIRLLQYPKGSEYLPAHTFFIFNVNVEEIVRSTIERCYQAVYNCIVRRNHELETHKSLIERKAIIDAVITNLRLSSEQADIEQQIEELNQSFSTHDKDLLEKLKKLSHRLELCELQVDDSLFLFQSYLSISMFS